MAPEIENLPDVAFGKSNYGTCLESSLYLAFGNNALSYATLMNDWEPMSWHGKMFDMFEKHRALLKRLSAASNIGKCGGLLLVKSPRAYRMPLSEEQAPFTWTEMNSSGQRAFTLRNTFCVIMRIGRVPVCC